MDANEVVMHVDLLGKGVRQAGEAAHMHPHGEVLPFHVRRADVLHVGIAKPDDFLRAVADRRAVPLLAFRLVAVVLHQLCEIDFIREGINHGVQINLVAIARQLDAVGKALLKVLIELRGASCVPLSHEPRANQLRFGVNRYPCPHVAAHAVPG